ncbi:transposase [Bythopirellula goksoeyrii]|uniref:Transposase IS200 like protein n=1 Tax=Bythopirellula goksoeyrii TaxID=1400387 RepID=A0A5B9QBZ3_9BACT|nr:transposase [Bythopirellula goksoeyrii]QEG36478.1 Transposase IS200 like protein [Bythopirellula goksoeyrii]
MVDNSSFHLPPPSGFRGLHPDLPIQRYERHLPHWRQAGATYFVTFRLADSLPQSNLHLLKQLRSDWERTHPPPRSEKDWTEYAREVTTSVEHWLDEGYGVCHFRNKRWCEELRSRLHHFQDQRYQLSCWAILPNHCHAILRPFEGYSLEDLVGSLKGVAARNINSVLGLSGQLWQEESFDRILRDEEHLWRVVQYIGANPRKAGLENENAWRRWIHPDWEAAGWGFQDS